MSMRGGDFGVGAGVVERFRRGGVSARQRYAGAAPSFKSCSRRVLT